MTSILALVKALINNAKALLNRGVNAKDECGRTALMRAAYSGSTDTVKTLMGKLSRTHSQKIILEVPMHVLVFIKN